MSPTAIKPLLRFRLSGKRVSSQGCHAAVMRRAVAGQYADAIEVQGLPPGARPLNSKCFVEQVQSALSTSTQGSSDSSAIRFFHGAPSAHTSRSAVCDPDSLKKSRTGL